MDFGFLTYCNTALRKTKSITDNHKQKKSHPDTDQIYQQMT